MPAAWWPGAPSMPTAIRGSASRQPRISCGESMPLRAGWLANISASRTRRELMESARKCRPRTARRSLAGVLAERAPVAPGPAPS